MDSFLLKKKDINSKTILHKNLCNMHIAPRNMHIAPVSILQPTYVLEAIWILLQYAYCDVQYAYSVGYMAWEWIHIISLNSWMAVLMVLVQKIKSYEPMSQIVSPVSQFFWY